MALIIVRSAESRVVAAAGRSGGIVALTASAACVLIEKLLLGFREF
jgi:hypothetical protein